MNFDSLENVSNIEKSHIKANLPNYDVKKLTNIKELNSIDGLPYYVLYRHKRIFISDSPLTYLLEHLAITKESSRPMPWTLSPLMPSTEYFLVSRHRYSLNSMSVNAFGPLNWQTWISFAALFISLLVAVILYQILKQGLSLQTTLEALDKFMWPSHTLNGE